MKRRQFVQQTSVAGGALMISPSLIHWSAVKDKHIGVQLWSVREEIGKDPVATIQGVAKAGYKEVEGFGYSDGKFFGMSATDFAMAIQDAGMAMPSVHYSVNLASWNSDTGQLTDAAKAAFAAFAELGLKMVVCPYIADDQRDGKSIHMLAEIFNHAGALAKQHGMSFAYHNHDFEFKKVDGEYIYDVLISGTDPKLVDFQMDLYWVVHAKQNPADWINKLRSRLTSFHMKDMAANGDSAEVGTGSINFAEIIALPGASNVQYYIVELEHYVTTPLQGIALANTNLKKLLGSR